VREGLGPNGEVLGEMRAMGIRPKFMEVLNSRGIFLPSSLFDPYRPKGPAA
jgi:pilus assembly protein CpaF